MKRCTTKLDLDQGKLSFAGDVITYVLKRYRNINVSCDSTPAIPCCTHNHKFLGAVFNLTAPKSCLASTRT